jgi:hypothetical protein
MASFYAFDFEYDGIPSQRFDLKIITFEDGGLFGGVGSSNVNILSQRVLRKSKPYYLGRTQEPVLEFPLTFGTSKPINAMDRDLISAWLFGRAGYKKLYIMQDDLNGAYFNCMLKEPEPQYIGNLNYAFNCTVSCDSPFAYGPERIISGSVVYGGLGTSFNPLYFNIYNNSSEEEYLYPVINVLVGYNNSWFSIKNITDSNRLSLWKGLGTLSDGTQLSIDNDLQLISYDPPPSASSESFLSNFNKNWFRLLPHNNEIELIVHFAGVYPTSSSYFIYEIRWIERFKIGG